MALINAVITVLKEDRAPGVDNITFCMLKLSSVKFRERLTDMVKDIWTNIPESLIIGKMTLSHKKEPSLLVGKKRPVCVTATILCLLMKIMHTRMDKVCEK